MAEKEEALIIHSVHAEEDTMLVGYTNAIHFALIKNKDALRKELERRLAFALFFLDARLDDSLNTMDLLKELRELNEDLPVVIVAPREKPQDVLSASKYNVQGILLKPFSQSDFESRLNPFCAQPLKWEEIALSSTQPKSKETSEALWSPQDKIETVFFAAQNFMLQEKFDLALEAFQFINKRKDLANDEEVLLQERSLFETGRCLMSLKQSKKAVEQFQFFIKACPRSYFINDAWFHIGEIFHKANQLQNAKICYQRAINIPNPRNPGIIQRAKRMLKSLG